jgi:hypothetical protein
MDPLITTEPRFRKAAVSMDDASVDRVRFLAKVQSSTMSGVIRRLILKEYEQTTATTTEDNST